MVEFITAAFSSVNIVFTVLLLLMGLYWITVILGVLDVDLFHIHLPHADLDAHVGMDGGMDADMHVDGDAGIHAEPGGLLHSFLHFFYIGEVPTMVLASIMILSLWTFSMLGNYYFNPNGSMVMAIPIFVGNLVASAFVMKLFAMPLRRLYTMLNKDYNAPGDVIGRIGRVTTTRVTKDKMGQVEVSTKGAPIILNVLSQDDHEFARGDEAVVVSKDSERGTYTIAPVDLEK